MKAVLKIVLLLSVVLYLTSALTACNRLAQQPTAPLSSRDKVVFGDTFVLAAGDTIDGNLTVMGGSVVLSADSTVNGDISLFGGTLSLDSGATALGDLNVLGGDAMVAGYLGGDISILGGSVTRASSANVTGNVETLGGSYHVETAVAAAATATTMQPSPPTVAVQLPTASAAAMVVQTGVYTLRSDTVLKNDLLVLGGEVLLESGAILQGNLILEDGKARIEPAAQVQGDVLQRGGNLQLAGLVTGNLTLLSGDAGLLRGVIVQGQVRRSGGTLENPAQLPILSVTPVTVAPVNTLSPANTLIPLATPLPRATLTDSSATDTTDDDLQRYSRQTRSFGQRLVVDLFDALSISLLLALLAMTIHAKFEPNLRRLQHALQQNNRVGIGLLGLLTPFLVLAAALMCVLVGLFVITLPLTVLGILVLLFATMGALLLAWVIWGYWFGQQVLRLRYFPQLQPIFMTGLGTYLCTVVWQLTQLFILPVWVHLLGWLAFTLACALGLGAVLLTRFGRRTYLAVGRTDSSKP
jgi:hypothetical protein